MALAMADILNSMNPAQSNKKANAAMPEAMAKNMANAEKSFQQGDVSFEPTNRAASAYKALSMESYYQYSETMSLQLTTKEGDKVSIDYRQLYAQYQSYKEFQAAQNSQQDPQGVRFFESKEALEATEFSEHIGFSVQGELNEDELKAIYDVFEKVDKLANHFFSGDIEKAFQKAVELEVDFSQIGSLSLNLTQTEMKAVQYQQVAMAEYEKAKKEALQEEGDSQQGQTNQLPVYLQQWQAAIERLDEMFADASEKVTEWVGEVAAQRFPEQGDRSSWLERVRDFHEQMQQAITKDESANEETALENLGQEGLEKGDSSPISKS